MSGRIHGMPSTVEDLYQQALTDLGARKLWYQTSTDLFFAAVVAAVDGVDAEEVLARSSKLADVLPLGHALHYVSHTVAAVSAARDIPVESFVAATDAAAGTLRDGIRSGRIRHIAGAVMAVGGTSAFQVRGDAVVGLYRSWNQRHRLLTTGPDLVVAAITEASGLDPATALDRAATAFGQLASGGYRDEWLVARILALDPAASADRFLRLADDLRGRRRKPLPDRRHTIAIAALSDHPPAELTSTLIERVSAVRPGRLRPDGGTAFTLAALLTLGASVPGGHRLHRAFHAFVLREHYVRSYREATAD